MTLPAFLSYPSQPDYMETVDTFHPNLPLIIAQTWTEGDDEERADIDYWLERSRSRQYQDQDDEHHRMIFGAGRLL